MDKAFDIIVYGATGFTGYEIASYISGLETKTFRWAIAGRSLNKLNKLKTELKLDQSVEVLVADSQDFDELVNIFSYSKLVLNCTGPYRFLGENIVRACIQSKSHYMDICGEPQFIENMFLKYFYSAKDANVLIVHACAFDSVPADFGFLFTMNQYPPNCCNTIESFLNINAGPSGIAGHQTTYECAVHGIGDASTLQSIRRNIDDVFHPPRLTPAGKRLNRYSSVHYDERVGQYVIPFMGADASVVKCTARSLSLSLQVGVGVQEEEKQQRQHLPDSKDEITGKSEKPFIWPQYAAYACIGQWSRMLAVALYGGVFSSLATFDYGRSLLLAYPEWFSGGIFSHAGPTSDQLKETSFEMNFIARGWRSLEEREGHKEERGGEGEGDVEVRTRVRGPEPGYVATPIIFVVLANHLLHEYDSSGSDIPRGGVFTPGGVFRSCVHSLVKKLTESGVSFEVIATDA